MIEVIVHWYHEYNIEVEFMRFKKIDIHSQGELNMGMAIDLT